ncbi:MAG: hypothetical protein PHY94_00345 [Candidatus Omnitrophica bacterium]|nr:hypothetical protein [Candidatus Omnitrophota bacterium]
MFKLVRLLREKYATVDFCVLSDNVRRRKEMLIAGVPKERLSLPHFSDINALPVNSLKELIWYIFKADLVIMSSIKGLEKIHNLFKIFNSFTIQLNDTPEFFSYHFGPDIFVLPSEAYKRNTLSNQKFPEEKIYITGDIRFDSVLEEVPEPKRNYFYKEYNLDRGRPFVIFCPGAVQRIDDWAKELYLKILGHIKDSEYQVIIRMHPEEWTGHKRPRGMHVMSNKLLYPEIPVIKPWDVDTAMKLCSFIVSVDSSVILEASNYRKNSVAVNFHEASLTDEGRKKEIFPTKRYDGCGLKGLIRDANNQVIQSKYLRNFCSHYSTVGWRVIEFEWLGADCHISELPLVLRSKEILQINEAAFNKHIEKFWYKRDGNASQRICELVKEAINNETFRRKIFVPPLKKACFAIFRLAVFAFKKILAKTKIPKHK